MGVAVVDQHHLMARRVVDEVVVYALIFEQSRDEIEVALLVLHTIVDCGIVGFQLVAFGAVQNICSDFFDRLTLEDPVRPVEGQELLLGPQRQPIVMPILVMLELGIIPHEAIEPAAEITTSGRREFNRCIGAEQLVERLRIRADGVDYDGERLAEPLDCGHAQEKQLVLAEVGVEPADAVILRVSAFGHRALP